MKETEDSIQKHIVSWLKLKYGDKLVRIIHIPNEAGYVAPNLSQASARWNRMKAMGSCPGAPDLVLLFRGGITLFVEVKNLKGSLNKNQILFHKDVNDAGHVVIMVRGFIDACAKITIAYDSLKQKKQTIDALVAEIEDGRVQRYWEDGEKGGYKIEDEKL